MEYADTSSSEDRRRVRRPSPADVAFSVIAAVLTLLHFPLANVRLRWPQLLFVVLLGSGYLFLAAVRGSRSWPEFIRENPRPVLVVVGLALVAGGAWVARSGAAELTRGDVLVVILWTSVIATFGLLFYSERDEKFWGQAANALLTGLVLALAAFIVNTALSQATRDRIEQDTRLAINQGEQSVFRRQDLSGFDLSGMRLEQNFDFNYSDLTGVDFTDADMAGASLRNAVATGGVFELARLNNADLTQANLDGARLLGAQFADASLNGASLRLATVKPVARAIGDPNAGLASSRRADAAEDSAAEGSTVSFQGAQLVGADLTGADLTNADLTGANLNGAILDGAILHGAKLKGASVMGEQLEQADLDGETVCPSGGKADPDCSGEDTPRGPAAKDLSILVSEGVPAGTVLGTVAVTGTEPEPDFRFQLEDGNAGPFRVDAATGEITLDGEVDLDEVPEGFEVTVTDETMAAVGETEAQDTAAISVTVNRAPTFQADPHRFQTTDFTQLGSHIGTVVAGDADGPDPVTYALLTSDPGLPFAIDTETGEITVVGPLRVENPYEFDVEAVDAASPPGRRRARVVIDVQHFTHVAEDSDTFETLAERFYGDPAWASLIEEANPGRVVEPGVELVIPALPQAPIVDEPNLEFDVPHSAATGWLVGQIRAEDPQNDRVTFGLEGDDLPFAIDPVTGAITTTAPLPGSETYTMVVTATDDGDVPQTSSISVTVTSAGNHPPAIEPIEWPSPIVHTHEPGFVLGRVTATDLDGDAVSFTMAPGPPFAIDAGTGAIQVAGELRPVDSPYVLTVEASDGTSTSTATIRLAVVYEVQSGDSLWEIAGRHYRDPNLWLCIQDANRLESSAISAAQRLTIPNEESCG